MTLRQTLLLHHLLQGKSARQAALAAGYEKSTVDHKLAKLLAAPSLRQQLERHQARLEHTRNTFQHILSVCHQVSVSATTKENLRLSAARTMLSTTRELRRILPQELTQEQTEHASATPTHNPTTAPPALQPNYNQNLSQSAHLEPQRVNANNNSPYPQDAHLTQAELDEEEREMQELEHFDALDL